MAQILAISSHVTRGHVGLNATVPALQFLGHEVWALPTVLLASRAGLGRVARHEVCAAHLADALSALESDGCWASLGAVFAGYFPSARSVKIAARAIAAIKAARPGIPVFIDPILGDAGRLYVERETADAIRNELVPLASIASPNLFELAWLTSGSVRTLDEVATSARRLGPTAVVVTSAAHTEECVTSLLVTASEQHTRFLPRRQRIPNGAGDLFAGLLLGRLLAQSSVSSAFDASHDDLDRVLTASEGASVLRLSALGQTKRC
jgi:pyridoxine kinase